jgi:maleylacetoacetate isomerase
MVSIKLYGYWRSSATYRLRIALNLKEIEYEYIPVHLVKDGGEQHQQNYKSLNPTELVPTLIDDEYDLVLNQSMAIIEYLDERYPAINRLLPLDSSDKVRVRALSQDIACDVQPITNLRIVQYLKNELSLSDVQQQRWLVHWIEKGLRSFEKRLRYTAGQYCFANDITMADVCLVPQVYNALRYSIDLNAFPLIKRIYQNCNKISAFDAAKPENQLDAQ